MAISTNSIIHYTSSFKTLETILKEGFKIKYCLEYLELDDKRIKAAHPMISFCDIPLSDSKQHFSAYGKYGIGLSKDWAIKNGINPVVYIDRNSLFAQCIKDLLLERHKDNSNLNSDQLERILQIKSYAKNYSGLLKKHSINNPNYKFYDEREWRLVPPKKDIGDASFSVPSDSYLKRKDKYNDGIAKYRVKFSINDISYIIVKSTNQIPKIINYLRSVYSDKCTVDELEILFSKVCSTEQIIADY